MIRFASLGSGSKGNALLVEAGHTRVLVDCGFGQREMARRLERLEIEPASVDAVLVTHEHADHVGGVARCAARFGWTVHASHGTAAAARQLAEVAVRRFDSHAAFAIGDLEIHPYPVPHDAREPTQFVFSDGAIRLGLLTDAGMITPHIVAMLADCAALVLEANHDAAMLANGRYPPQLKRRIAGGFGHLDNTAAAGLLRTLDSARLQHVVAAHLSEENNTPVLARAALAAGLGCTPDWIGIADQATGCDWRELR
ncbi:MAG: MBL fold metallo-hydrolase [Rhodocyclaceae bacterium]|nr:MBL fold metallo-hydrolase [Rhodocyclaceae bacterium]